MNKCSTSYRGWEFNIAFNFDSILQSNTAVKVYSFIPVMSLALRISFI